VNADDVFETAEAFRAEVRQFCRERLPSWLTRKVFANLWLEKEDYLAYLRLLNERGWAAGHWPARHGGCDWTPLQRFVFEEETAIAGAPWLIPFGVNYVGPVIIGFGSEAQKARFLPRILDSSDWWAQGYSEPGAGSDLAGLRTRAVRQGDHYVVTGQKLWTSYVQWADWLFCLVRTSDEARPQSGISFLLIDMKSPGVTVRPVVTMDMCHHVNEVFLDEVRVPVSNLVGEEGGGWTYAKFLLSNERVLAAEAGRSIRVFARLEDLARRTLRGGRPLAEDPAFARRIAELRLKLFVLQSTCFQAVSETMAGAEPGAEASLMKIRGTELQQEIAEAMVDALGLAGIVYDPQALLRDGMPPEGPADATGIVREHLHIRAASIYGGSNEIQRNIIAKAVLGL
jgi:alkylation response protein AidB-like acyl-CoA dehydrogenase